MATVSVVICEKASQAGNVRAAVGDAYGRVVAAQGHLLRLEEPDEVNAAWKRWNNDVLVPPAGRYGYVNDEAAGKAERLAAIGAALKGARRVFIATDCDREGQAIGESIVRYFAFKGEVLRVMFSAEDKTTLQAAFKAARPNAEFERLYEAAVARQQADQIYNLTLTRVATNVLRPDGWKGALGIGRVKTPTLGIVCSRELEIRAFKARAFFEISAVVKGAGGAVELWHRPQGEARVLDAATARALADAARAYRGPIAVAKEHKHTAPPKPLDLPTLQKAAGKWGWSAKKSLDTLQALYELHVVTYPRSETRFLPEALGSAAPRLLGVLRQIFSSAPDTAVIRPTVYSDAGLNGAPHHAVVPNAAVANELGEILARLSVDQRRLFDLVALGWLQAVSADHEFEETRMAIDVPWNGATFKFSVSGRIELVAGWKGLGSDRTEEEDGDDKAIETTLPALADGESVSAGSVRVVEKSTTPPVRFSEGELVDAMRHAWRFVPEGPVRERLKEAKGIGTPATRDSVIEGLKGQRLVESVKGRLRPTEVGLWLYGLLAAGAQDLIDVGGTAQMESRLDAVLSGAVSADGVVAEVVERTRAVVAQVIAAGADKDEAQPVVRRAPTAKMLLAARMKAARAGTRKLPKEVLSSFDACRDFLGPLPATPGAASEAQLTLIKSLIDQGHPAPDGFPAAVSAAAARAWISAALEELRQRRR